MSRMVFAVTSWIGHFQCGLTKTWQTVLFFQLPWFLFVQPGHCINYDELAMDQGPAGHCINYDELAMDQALAGH